ncbi:MAG: FAD/NAD(P)-binding protein [Patescibacteria group bacterium]|nr:FAD/NAD(P)-binding protein [Patescibacteria group bacterium]MDD5715204.1 FAD/NAD(P)-binding protein [Patescibacteria group bacterium]
MAIGIKPQYGTVLRYEQRKRHLNLIIMLNPYQTQEAKITGTEQQTPNVKSFRFKLKSGGALVYNPGQFFVFSLPGFGESVFVPAESLTEKNTYDIAVMNVGRVTGKFHELKAGDTFGVRGPYGNGFDLKKFEKKNILLIAGGLGLVPLRSLLHYLINRNLLDTEHRQVQLLYGCRDLGAILFKSEMKKLGKMFTITMSMDQGTDTTIGPISCYKGVITVLFKKADVVKNGVAVLCGPPIMFKFVVPEVQNVGYSDESIYLSLERRMHCAGLGTCQHCAIGPYYVCKDGPVFTYAQLKDTVQYK